MLRERNGWIDNIATLFMFVGAVAPFVIFGRNFNSVGLWACGLMVKGGVVDNLPKLYDLIHEGAQILPKH